MKERKQIYRVFTKKALIAANQKAIQEKRNRTIQPQFLEKLPPLLYPVYNSFLHTDEEIRLTIIFPTQQDENGEWYIVHGFLDMALDDYYQLPGIKMKGPSNAK